LSQKIASAILFANAVNVVTAPVWDNARSIKPKFYRCEARP